MHGKPQACRATKPSSAWLRTVSELTNANAYAGTSGSLALYPPFVANGQPAGDAWDNVPGDDICGNSQGPSGDVVLGLISLGYLNPNGTPKTGIDYIFDDCAKTVIFYKLCKVGV